MGRVARYKKIKSCDPYSKEKKGSSLERVGVWGLGDNGRKVKKRSKTSEKLRARKRKRGHPAEDRSQMFDTAPTGEDDFDLSDLVGSLKKEKPTVPQIEETSTIAADLKPVKKTAVNPFGDQALQDTKLLKIDKQIEKEIRPSFAVERLPGESKNAFNRRFRNGTSLMMKNTKQTATNPEKKVRKKEFLKMKKLKKKGKLPSAANFGGEVAGVNNDDKDDDPLVTVDKDTTVPFGVQAERPPTFKQIPRGAAKKKSAKSQSSLATDEQVEAERRAMDLMRRKVQAQYRAIKSQRRLNGEFHL